MPKIRIAMIGMSYPPAPAAGNALIQDGTVPAILTSMAKRISKKAREAAERAALIEKLGMKPETDARNCCSTGELWGFVAEQFGVDEANRISDGL